MREPTTAIVRFDNVSERREANRAVGVSAIGLALTGLIELAIALLTGSVGPDRNGRPEPHNPASSKKGDITLSSPGDRECDHQFGRVLDAASGSYSCLGSGIGAR